MSAESTPTPPAPAPVSSEVKELESMVRQTDLLKEQLNEVSRSKTLADEERAELQRLRELERQRLEEYARENLPKAEEYIKFLEERDGKPLVDEDKQAYRRAFTTPEERYKRAAGRFVSDMEHHKAQAVQLAASRKELEQKEAERKAELERALAEKKKLTELIAQGSGNMRASYAAMLSEGMTMAQQEATEEIRKPVAASRLNPGDILMPAPTQQERDFLAMYNYSDKVGVNASSNDPWAPEQRMFRTSMPPIPEHRQLYNSEGELNFPMSKRYTDPTVMSWLVNESGLPTADNLSQFVSLNASRTFIEAKAVDDRARN